MEFHDLLPDLGGSFTVIFYVTELSVGYVLHNQLFGKIVIEIPLPGVNGIGRFARPRDLSDDVMPYLTNPEKGNQSA